MKLTVIGIADTPTPFFPPEVMAEIQKGKLFSGGKRHHEIMRPYLPQDAPWIDITAPLSRVFDAFRAQSDDIIVFASGDPLFFGFANTILREMPEAALTVYPHFNSLQTLAHRISLPYHDMHCVSLTGRPWPAFDHALIDRTAKIGILTDREHTPAAIAKRMLEYGYDNYVMHVGEHLGNPTHERVATWSLEDASRAEFNFPNCLILCSQHPQPRRFGIPDHEFALLDGREKMITKMPIRLLTLQTLRLAEKRVFWDIGFCTGSVSIEARLLFPHLQIEAFEIRPECEELMRVNSRRFGAPGIHVHIGDFLETDLSDLPQPDAVFIGGHGGRLKEIMERVLAVLLPGGCIVTNSVHSPIVQKLTDRPSSRQLFHQACEELGLVEMPPTHIQLNDYNPIDILTCKRP